MAERLEKSGRVASCECCQSTENLRRCSKCRGVFYCSREHQLQDWKKHKRSCKKTSTQTQLSCETVITKNLNSAAKSTNWCSSVPNNRAVKGKDSSEDAENNNSLNPPKDREVPVKFTSNSTPTASENGNLRSSDAKLGHEEDMENGLQSRPKLSLQFDPRPFVRTDFPQPKSRDGDTVAKHAAAQLIRYGRCVLNKFLADDTARMVLKEVKAIQDSGVLVDGPLSGGQTSSEKSKEFTEKAIRGDKITWLQGNEACYPSIRTLISQMDELMQRLNHYLQGLYNISGRTKAMVACYPGNGTGYAHHVDNPNRDGRCVTCLFYLNEDWDVKTQGGLLRLLPSSGDYVDVEPFLNRLLLFWSDCRNPHEVQPAFDMRYAITAWYFDKTEREEAKMAQLNEDMSKLRGEVSLLDVKAQKQEKEQLQQEIQTVSDNAVVGLSHGELQALSTMLEGQPDPRAVLTGLGVAPLIQDALLCHLKEMKS